MTLGIEKGRMVKELRQHFTTIYPYLTIQFIKKVSGKEEAMLDNELFQSHPVVINIDKNQTVGKLEEECFSKTGLKAKVYRRFCNVWIEATLTEDWTLEQQNEEGQLLSQLNEAAF